MEFTNNIQTLIQFKYQGIHYYIVSRNNKIYAVCYDNKKIRIHLKKYERNIILKVFSEFLADEKTSVKVDTAIVNSNEYVIFYDTKYKNYHWKNKNPELNNNPTDNEILNMKYNNQSIIQYSKNEISKGTFPNKYFNKVVFLASTGALVIAFALSSICPLLVPQSINISYVENGKVFFNEEFFDLPAEDKSNEYREVYENPNGMQAEFNLKTLENAIDRNDNLSDKEKEFIKYFYEILDEHKEYIDFNLLTIRLNTLNIVYTGFYTSVISGEYDDQKNVISFYNWNGKNVSDFENTDKLTAVHEIGHTFTTGISGIIHECSNEAWARAALDKFYSQNKVPTGSYSKNEDGKHELQGGGYQGFIPFYYMLTQFMTDEEILKFQYSGDLNIIGNALINTEKTYANNYSESKAEERAYGLLSKIDNKFENGAGFYSGKIATETLKSLDYYYKIKNGKNLYDDLNMFLLSDCVPYYNNFLKENDLSFYQKNNIEDKKSFFIQIVKEELIKNKQIDISDQIDVGFYLLSYPDIFSKETDKGNIVIYINDITVNNQEKKQVSLELEITPEICRRYERLCNEKTVSSR